MRHLPWVILTYVVAAFLTTLLVSSAVHSGFNTFGVADFRPVSFFPIALSSIIAFIAGVVFFAVMVRNRKVMTFTDEVIGELFKVTWPSRDETLKASVTVVATTAFTASLMAVYDVIWVRVFRGVDYVMENQLYKVSVLMDTISTLIS